MFYTFHWTENPFKDKEYELNSFNRFGEIGRKVSWLQDEVPFTELFPSGFMERYTNFASIDDLLAKSGFTLETVEDFVNIPGIDWNAFIAATTCFANWEEMLQKAYAEHSQRLFPG